ncbi:hypothetical protein Q9966_004588 [Columba livia]|nr:hypothetical protein Q9966_004588 [Columba livia]
MDHRCEPRPQFPEVRNLTESCLRGFLCSTEHLLRVESSEEESQGFTQLDFIESGCICQTI